MSGPRGFRAYATTPHDGDSFWVMCDVAGDMRWEPELRLIDVHAPELITMRLPRKGQPGGHEVTEFVANWMAHAREAEAPRRWWLWVETSLTRTLEATQKRTFTRYLATVWRYSEGRDGEGSDMSSLNADVATFLSGHPEWPPGD